MTEQEAHQTDQQFVTQLRQALLAAGMTGEITLPATHARLLERIVETAAQVIRAEAASLFLIDRESQELVFEVTLGQKAEEVKHFRVPLGHGIAGLVAVSGQPMIIAEADSDPRQASDISQSIGYRPRNILCVPLQHDDTVIGVLELLDKQDAPSFSQDDMVALSRFAELAALAIQNSELVRDQSALLMRVVSSIPGGSGAQRSRLQEQTGGFEARGRQDPTFQQVQNIVSMAANIVSHGPAAARLCLDLLTVIARHGRSEQESSRSGPAE
jgi:GAF domain-containing protein